MVTRQNHLSWILVLGVPLASAACRSKLDVKATGSTRGAVICPEGQELAAATDPSASQEPDRCVPIPTEQPGGSDGGDSPSDKPTDEPDPVPPTPKELANMLQFDGKKTHFQSRDIITLRVPKTMFEGASRYQIENITREADDQEPVILQDEAIEAETPTLRSNYYADRRMALVAQEDHYVFAFFPGQGAWAGRFFYGKNKLRLSVDDNVNPRYSLIEFTLRDFPVFGMEASSFAGNVQVSKGASYQYQGWVSVLSPAVVSVTNAGNVVNKLVHGTGHMINPH